MDEAKSKASHIPNLGENSFQIQILNPWFTSVISILWKTYGIQPTRLQKTKNKV